MTQKKVTVAIFDADLRCTVKKYPLSKNGRQIDISSGGTEHFMPRFDHKCRLELPSWKKYGVVGPRTYKPVYFVANKGKKCVDFTIPEVYGPSPEELDGAVEALIATKIGSEGIKLPWYIPVLLFINLVFSFIIASAVGVF